MTAKAIDVSPRFFLYVYVLSLCLIGGYLSCSVYNFLWIVHPSVGTLSAFLEGCNRQTDSYTDNSKEANKENRRRSGKNGPTVRLNLYFKVGS